VVDAPDAPVEAVAAAARVLEEEGQLKEAEAAMAAAKKAAVAAEYDVKAKEVATTLLMAQLIPDELAPITEMSEAEADSYVLERCPKCRDVNDGKDPREICGRTPEAAHARSPACSACAVCVVGLNSQHPTTNLWQFGDNIKKAVSATKKGVQDIEKKAKKVLDDAIKKAEEIRKHIEREAKKAIEAAGSAIKEGVMKPIKAMVDNINGLPKRVMDAVVVAPDVIIKFLISIKDTAVRAGAALVKGIKIGCAKTKEFCFPNVATLDIEPGSPTFGRCKEDSCLDLCEKPSFEFCYPASTCKSAATTELSSAEASVTPLKDDTTNLWWGQPEARRRRRRTDRSKPKESVPTPPPTPAPTGSNAGSLNR
jgi:phage FluMu protein Com